MLMVEPLSRALLPLALSPTMSPTVSPQIHHQSYHQPDGLANHQPHRQPDFQATGDAVVEWDHKIVPPPRPPTPQSSPSFPSSSPTLRLLHHMVTISSDRREETVRVGAGVGPAGSLFGGGSPGVGPRRWL